MSGIRVQGVIVACETGINCARQMIIPRSVASCRRRPMSGTLDLVPWYGAHDRSGSDEGTMRIGELAKAAGVNVQTIRFYERRRLLTAPARSSAGYRAYSADVVR